MTVCLAVACKLICFCSVHLDNELMTANWQHSIQEIVPKLAFEGNLEGPELELDTQDDLTVSKPTRLMSCSIDTAIVSAW